jgi:hypothetical protein
MRYGPTLGEGRAKGGAPPTGATSGVALPLIAHVASPTDNGGWLVIDVWEDQGSMDAWNQRLQGAFGRYERGQDIRPPQVRVLEPRNIVTR